MMNKKECLSKKNVKCQIQQIIVNKEYRISSYSFRTFKYKFKKEQFPRKLHEEIRYVFNKIVVQTLILTGVYRTEHDGENEIVDMQYIVHIVKKTEKYLDDMVQNKVGRLLVKTLDYQTS